MQAKKKKKDKYSSWSRLSIYQALDPSINSS